MFVLITIEELFLIKIGRILSSLFAQVIHIHLTTLGWNSGFGKLQVLGSDHILG
jgi:hypothetical protein